ncbi:MAG: hypothetical protein ACRBBV_09975 [Paracoccaceae bacterium]
MEKSITVTTYKPSIAEVKGGTEWSELEQALLDACKTGEPVFPKDAVLPDNMDDSAAMIAALRPKNPSDPSRRVRASLIRYLLLGGCGASNGTRPHPKGVEVSGGWIDGALDLEGCETPLDLKLRYCLVLETPNLTGAHLTGLYLNGSRCQAGMNLNRLVIDEDLILRGGFDCSGTVDLGGARIDGTLSCIGGRFDGKGGTALDGAAMVVGADVFLRSGFCAIGLVNLIRARIGGQLSCNGGRFDSGNAMALDCDTITVGASVFFRECSNAIPSHLTGDVDFTRAQIGGNLQFIGATIDGAAKFESARIEEGLFWQGIRGKVSTLDLTEAQVGVLRDDSESWQRVEKYHLSGFRYDRLHNHLSLSMRRDWLAHKHEEELTGPNGHNARDFDPQPYTQLASVLDKAGHRTAAAEILYARENKLRQVALPRARAISRGTFVQERRIYFLMLRRLWDWGFQGVFGYGHRPALALAWVFGLWLFSWALYGAAYQSGQMAPNSDVILTSSEWLAAVNNPNACQPVAWGSGKPHNENCTMPLDIWLETARSAPDYETFNARLYALDLFVPLDALGQEQAWAPSRDRGWWGRIGYAARMWVQVAGWIITAVGAAVLTGLVGRKD